MGVASSQQGAPVTPVTPLKGPANADKENDPEQTSSKRIPPTGSERLAASKTRTMRIYERVDHDEQEELKPLPQLSADQEKILSSSLSHLFYGNEQVLSKDNMEFLLRRMSRLSFPASTRVVVEGDDATCVYVVEKGSLSISIKGKEVRQLVSGNLFGELALIFNSPRAASVDTTADCVLWALYRDDFKRMQRMLAADIIANHAKTLRTIPQIAKCLDETETAQLASDLAQAPFQIGNKLYTQGEPSSHVYLIEEGTVRLEFDEKQAESSLRVAGNSSSDSVGSSRSQFSLEVSEQQPLTAAVLASKWGILSTTSPSKPTGSACGSASVEGAASGAASGSASVDGADGGAAAEGSVTIMADRHTGRYSVVMGKGTIIVGPMLSKAGLGEWEWGQSKQPKTSSSKTQKSGALAPFSVVAVEHTRCIYFTTGIFEQKVGKLRDVLARTAPPAAPAPAPVSRANSEAIFTKEGAGRPSRLTLVQRTAVCKYAFASKEETFAKLAYKGHFALGYMALGQTAKCDEFPDDKPQVFFLKFCSKKKVVAKNQIKAVKDEGKILMSLDNPFIVKLLGKFETPNTLVYVLEQLCTIDLWSRIYAPTTEIGVDGKQVSAPTPLSTTDHDRVHKKGLSNEAVRFYAANVVLALAHMHARKVAFRNLKPENCLFDGAGYLKLVGLGFAKRIPFKMFGSIQHKSYTLCGTPEYLAPELVLNTGHDHQVDMWALGVLMYEMCLGTTPFASNKGDIVDIIKKIGAVKVRTSCAAVWVSVRSCPHHACFVACPSASSTSEVQVPLPPCAGRPRAQPQGLHLQVPLLLAR